jgi:hypothetical protein
VAGVAASRPALPLLLLVAGCATHGATSIAVADAEGRVHQPLRLEGLRASVLFFVTTDCPIANQYAPEIAAIAADHAAQPVHFWVVQVDPDLTAEKAREHARSYGIPCPVLLDRGHDLVCFAGATLTPEAAIVTADGLVYRGRIDDLYADFGEKRAVVTRHDLRQALAAVLAGKPVPPPTGPAVGCFIPQR